MEQGIIDVLSNFGLPAVLVGVMIWLVLYLIKRSDVKETQYQEFLKTMVQDNGKIIERNTAAFDKVTSLIIKSTKE